MNKPHISIERDATDDSHLEPVDTIDSHEEIFEINPDPISFAPSDLVYVKFVNFLAEEGTQRERDVAIVCESLQRLWRLLHIEIQCFGAGLPESELHNLGLLCPALKRIGKIDWMLDGLGPELSQLVIEASE